MTDNRQREIPPLKWGGMSLIYLLDSETPGTVAITFIYPIPQLLVYGRWVELVF
ncbi:hypothetical protein Cal7507_3254 [Calothrix sp. PCC 7507]|nr:hypothetical protein Cal7507_3254 [Calothrix sp. PCC 7507]